MGKEDNSMKYIKYIIVLLMCISLTGCLTVPFINIGYTNIYIEDNDNVKTGDINGKLSGVPGL